MLDQFRLNAHELLFLFYVSGERNQHIAPDPLVAYVRRSNRLWGPCLDIASVSVWPENWRQGYFKAFLREAEKIAQEHIGSIMVECVHDKHLHAFMRRQPYEIDNSGITFYRKF